MMNRDAVSVAVLTTLICLIIVICTGILVHIPDQTPHHPKSICNCASICQKHPTCELPECPNHK
jgi:hypothetical protein